MTRTLPWLKSGAAPSKKPVRAPSPPPPKQHKGEPAPKRRRVSTSPESDDGLDLDPAPTLSRATKALRALRTPSTSPPPAPPEQMLMREGFDHDDIWIMVEDEFYTTAQAFTQHLHHAEYQRLKQAAKEREVIERPTDDTTKHDEDEDDPWLGTQLAGLMDMPRQAQQLKAKELGTGKSNSKAAKGFTRSSQAQEGPSTLRRTVSRSVERSPKMDAVSPTSARKMWQSKTDPRVKFDAHVVDLDDDDDLDAPVRSLEKSGSPKAITSVDSFNLGISKPLVESQVSGSGGGSGMSRFAKRRAEREKARRAKEQEKVEDAKSRTDTTGRQGSDRRGSVSSVIEIPTFL